MGQYTFVGVCFFQVPESQYLAPHGANFALYEWGSGNAQDPANTYNIYSTPTPGAYLYQSQLNGMYLGMPAGSGYVCASFSDPGQAQPLIPTPYQNVTVFYLPDKIHFLGERDDETGWTWQTDQGGNWVFNTGGLQPTYWSLEQILAGKGTGGFTLNHADLTGYHFPPGTDLTGVNFSGAVLNMARLDHCNLTRTDFMNCSLPGASLKGVTCVGTIFNKANLLLAELKEGTWTDIKAAGAILDLAAFKMLTLTAAEMAGASLKQTLFGEVTISGGDFSGCDLTEVFAEGVKFVSDQSQPVVLNGAKLNFPLIGHDWRWMDLRNATIHQLPQPLSSPATQLQATGAKLSGLNENSLKGVTLEHAFLDYSLIDGLDLSGADLTGASLIEASLHGATLTNTKLPGANLSGTQLGSLGRLFTLPPSAEAALDAGQVSVLASLFGQNGVTLSPDATVETLAANRVWQLNDAGNHVVYTVRLEAGGGGAQVLTVYAPVAAASLVDAYLPNAVLTGANLYGALANGLQFYGSGARLDGSAILEEAQLNDSNLSNLNLTQARLLGANLSGAHLFNAKFNKADLTPSAAGVAANLSGANLQGADFTDARLYWANLSNAAVAVNVPTRAFPNQGGVYLFSLPYKGDTNTLQQYTAELDAASTLFSLNPDGDQPTLQKYVSALEGNNLGPLKLAFLKHQPPVVLSNNAQIQLISANSVWQIVDGAHAYTLWTDADENGDTELYAAPSLTKTQAAFQQNNVDLRWQASAAVDKPARQWLLDNDSENPQNLSLGYVRFILVLDGVLDVYGAAVRVERLGDKNQLQIETETCNVTALTAANMDGNTVCPNGTKLSTNQNTGGVQWDTKWLRAGPPPSPPTCVPTDYSWCPQTQAARQTPDGGGR